ncbi:MAG: hypothetical protein JO069_02820 [Verrucomicrobia bacterium]|nr:hypothetical protein [Verrucomicrobiota bacterium]
MLYLSESDLRFVVETVVTNRRDYDRIIDLIRGKEDLLEPMLEEPRLAERLLHEEQTLLRISPQLLFSILLRRVREELKNETYVLEADARGKRIPIFEAPAMVGLLCDQRTRDYLAELLASFARTDSRVIHWEECGAWRTRRFSDIDLDDMIELARIVAPEARPALYRRIAELALFLSGIFPDHAERFAGRRRFACSTGRTRKDYEEQGKRFYGLAIREADHRAWQPVLETLAAKFGVAQLTLNALSERYLKAHRTWYFRAATGG